MWDHLTVCSPFEGGQVACIDASGSVQLYDKSPGLSAGRRQQEGPVGMDKRNCKQQRRQQR